MDPSRPVWKRLRGPAGADAQAGDAAQVVVEVDTALCASFGRCIDLEPDAFRFDDNDQARPTEAAGRLPGRRLRAVIDACPTGAITAHKAERGPD